MYNPLGFQLIALGVSQSPWTLWFFMSILFSLKPCEDCQQFCLASQFVSSCFLVDPSFPCPKPPINCWMPRKEKQLRDMRSRLTSLCTFSLLDFVLTNPNIWKPETPIFVSLALFECFLPLPLLLLFMNQQMNRGNSAQDVGLRTKRERENKMSGSLFIRAPIPWQEPHLLDFNQILYYHIGH